MFFLVTALATFHIFRFFSKSTSKNMQTLTLENRISDPWKSCLGPPGVREPPVRDHCTIRRYLTYTANFTRTPSRPRLVVAG